LLHSTGSWHIHTQCQLSLNAISTRSPKSKQQNKSLLSTLLSIDLVTQFISKINECKVAEAATLYVMSCITQYAKPVLRASIQTPV